jgi:hypothetical protein
VLARSAARRSVVVGVAIAAAAGLIVLAGCGSASLSGRRIAGPDVGRWATMGQQSSAKQTAAAVPAPDISGLKFAAIDLGGPAEEYVSSWRSYSDSVTVQPAGGGLHCTIQVGSERAGYGGVRFAVKPFKALRLDLQLDDPASIAAVYVDAQDKQGRAVRWLWNMAQSPFNAAPPGPYVLEPGKPSGHFDCPESRDISAVSEVQIFVLAAQGTHTGFTLRKAEVGE